MSYVPPPSSITEMELLRLAALIGSLGARIDELQARVSELESAEAERESAEDEDNPRCGNERCNARASSCLRYQCCSKCTHR